VAAIRGDPTEQLTLNLNSASAPNCSTAHDPTESVDYAQGNRTELHERAANSKTDTRTDTDQEDSREDLTPLLEPAVAVQKLLDCPKGCLMQFF
jgi:hypothetical protein